MRRLAIEGARGGRWLVEVPTALPERIRGLRGRTLGAEEGMMFQRCRSVHTVGMAHPITIVFLDASWRVLRVERTHTGRLVFERRARHVLECHVGADVRVGDLLSPAEVPGRCPGGNANG